MYAAASACNRRGRPWRPGELVADLVIAAVSRATTFLPRRWKPSSRIISWSSPSSVRRTSSDLAPGEEGLTPHGLRHSHKTWMEEDGISEILQERRLGHEVLGMRGVYAHVSEAMRTELPPSWRRAGQRGWVRISAPG
jgi:integrase